MPYLTRATPLFAAAFLTSHMALADNNPSPKEVILIDPLPVPVDVQSPVQLQGPIDVNVQNTPLSVTLPVPVQAQVVGVPAVTVFGTPGVTIKNGSSSPVPVFVPEPVMTEDAAVRTPYGGHAYSSSGGSTCEVSIDAPDSPTRLVIETVSVRLSYVSTPVSAPSADLGLRIGNTGLRHFIDLGKWFISATNQGYAGTRTMRLYPDPGSTISLTVWSVAGILPSQCELGVSGYTLPDSSPSLAP